MGAEDAPPGLFIWKSVSCIFGSDHIDSAGDTCSGGLYLCADERHTKGIYPFPEMAVRTGSGGWIFRDTVLCEQSGNRLGRSVQKGCGCADIRNRQYLQFCFYDGEWDHFVYRDSGQWQ